MTVYMYLLHFHGIGLLLFWLVCFFVLFFSLCRSYSIFLYIFSLYYILSQLLSLLPSLSLIVFHIPSPFSTSCSISVFFTCVFFFFSFVAKATYNKISYRVIK